RSIFVVVLHKLSSFSSKTVAVQNRILSRHSRADCPNQSLDERMRLWHGRNRLDFGDVELASYALRFRCSHRAVQNLRTGLLGYSEERLTSSWYPKLATQYDASCPSVLHRSNRESPPAHQLYSFDEDTEHMDGRKTSRHGLLKRTGGRWRVVAP